LIIIGIILIVVYFSYVQPWMEKKELEEKKIIKEAFEVSVPNLYKVDREMCSQSCCSPQWPVSFDLKQDPRIAPGDLGTKIIPNNFSCSGENGGGCVCLEKPAYDMLYGRGLPEATLESSTWGAPFDK